MSERDVSGKERTTKVSEKKPEEDDDRQEPVASAPLQKQSKTGE